MAEGAGGLVFGREPGAIFAGDYRIVRQLAEGGMGAVYVVDQLSTGKARALKLMRPEIAQGADARRRFELEAKVGAKIESDHVVEIHSAGIDGTTPYIVMELLDGEDLSTRIEKSGPIAATETRELFEQLCHAVGAAHAAGIVHRDLKPENVFLARTKRAGGDARVLVKVLDFGIAKLVAESQTRHQTQGMIGTPMWMAPEQTELGKITPAADTWALGLILYYMLTGQYYWLAANDERSTITQLLKEVVMGPLPAASERARQQGAAGSIAPEIDAVIAGCLVREPSQRYATAQELWAALDTAFAPSSARVVVDRPPPGSPGGASTQPLGGPGRTAFAAPLSAHGSTVIAAPNVPPVPASLGTPLLHDPAIASAKTRDRRLLLGIPIAIVVMLGARECTSRIRTSLTEKKPSPVVVQRVARERVNAPIAKPGARPEDKTCRLCASYVMATGPVPRESIIVSLDNASTMLDQQCISARKRRQSGAVSFEFVVRDGRALNRHIEGATATDGTDECLLRALADVTFPSSAEETHVNATLSYNPGK